MVTYDLGSITDWLTSIGTVGSVITALYLANRDRKSRATVNVNYSYAVGFDYGISRIPISISISIVNDGSVPIYLKECAIKLKSQKNQRLYSVKGDNKVEKLSNPGDFYEHEFDYADYEGYLKKINIKKAKSIAYFQDAKGNFYKKKIILIS